jgi:hypothetical protein
MLINIKLRDWHYPINLVFHEILTVTKFLNIITSLINASTYFDTATITQMFIGIPLCIFTEESPYLQNEMK